MNTFYDFSAVSLQGQNCSMKEFEGKVVLVVNTASKCGLTPQYRGLEKLYGQYKEQGLEILGFPCNQFGGQEPGGTEAITQVCRVNYGVTFPMFSKVEVNGKNAHPLFVYLKEALPGFGWPEIKWNFTKFLIDRKGCPVRRFSPQSRPERIGKYISILLG